MLKLTSLIFIFLTFSASFLEIPASHFPNQELPFVQPKNQPRQLLEPVLSTLTILAMFSVFNLLVYRLKWRSNTNYQEIIYQIKNSHPLHIANEINEFYSKFYVKGIVNRCLITVKSSDLLEDIENRDYFMELCSVWARFTLNHLPLSIKFYDVTYNIQFFEQFLLRKYVWKQKEKNPLTVGFRNKRFVELITQEIEGESLTSSGKFSQTSDFRLMNLFFGPFWEVIYYEMFKKNLRPNLLNLKTSYQIEEESKESCFGCW